MASSDPAIPPRPVRKARRDSRGELIDAALEVILDKGIDAVRVDDICDRVGVTRGSLYWHFNDREGLIREALLEHLYRISDDQLSLLDEMIGTSDSRDEYLGKIGATLVDPFDPAQVEKRWQRLELLATTRRDSGLSALMSDIQRREQRFLTELMQQAQQRNILRKEVDPKAMAAVLVALSLGSNNLSLLGEDGPTSENWTALLLLLIELLFPAQ